MNDLVFEKDGKVLVSSRKIAEKFNKEHRDVLRAIRDLSSKKPNFTKREFTLSNYLDSTGRRLPMYELTRDGFTFLIMNFSGEKVLDWKIKYLEAFNAMEKKLLSKPMTQAEIILAQAQQLLNQERSILENKSRIEMIEDKVSLMDGDTGYYTVVGYCRINNIKAPLKMAQKYGKALTKRCKDIGCVIETVRDQKWGTVNSYPIEVLDDVIKIDD